MLNGYKPNIFKLMAPGFICYIDPQVSPITIIIEFNNFSVDQPYIHFSISCIVERKIASSLSYVKQCSWVIKIASNTDAVGQKNLEVSLLSCTHLGISCYLS